MLTLICMRGLPGSGKSTTASLLGVPVRVSRDDIRRDNFGREGVLAHTEERLITKIQFATAALALQNGVSVIVDDMNLRPAYLRDWNRLAVQQGAYFETVEVPTPVEECILRDAARGYQGGRLVGSEVIRDLAAKYMPKGQFLPYTPFTELPEKVDLDRVWEKVVFDPLLPHCVLVDIDGTMTMGPHDRSPYDMSKVSQDKPRRAVVNLVNRLLRDGYTVRFLSGREESSRADTVDWLWKHLDSKHCTQWDVFMRETGDNRKDDIVKYELFNRHIRGKFQPKFVLDDRPQVIRMWAALGLPVFDVDPTSGEF